MVEYYYKCIPSSDFLSRRNPHTIIIIGDSVNIEIKKNITKYKILPQKKIKNNVQKAA